MLSVSTMLIPFLEHNDGIRVNMVASQIRQAIALLEGEVPLIRTGLEDLFLEYTTYLYVAKDSGRVIFVGDHWLPYLVIRYDSGEIEYIDISPTVLEGIFDGTLFPTLKLGMSFSKGTPLARTRHISPDKKLILGKNLLTTFITYDGWNFEDAIVVSDDCSQKMKTIKWYEDEIIVDENHTLLSLYPNQYVPIINDGSYVEKNQVIFRISKDKLETVNELLLDNIEITAPESGIFYWNLISNIPSNARKYSKYVKWLNQQYRILAAREEQLKRSILQFDVEKVMERNIINKVHSHKRGKWLMDDGEPLNGTLIRYKIMHEEPLKIGSKISNRHGNKGVISRVLDQFEYITTSKDEVVDVVVGPLSPIARMNVGQLFEVHLNRATENFVNNYLRYSDTKREDLIKYIRMLDNTPRKFYSQKSEQFLNEIGTEGFNALLDDIYENGLQIIQPPFHSITGDQLLNIMKSTNTPFTEKIYVNGKEVDAVVGKMYFYRLLHEPEKKVLARSIGKYSLKLNQPVGGRKQGGGHRLGEMETWALMAYESYSFIKEYLNIKSDNVHERVRLLTHLINNTHRYYEPSKMDTISKETFISLLKSLGIDVHD